MGNYSIIVPETTTNLFLDPQFHGADPDTVWDITGDGAAPDFTRSTAEQWIGTGCAVADVDDGTYATIADAGTVTATSYMLSARVKRAASGTVSDTECNAYFDTAGGNWDSITALRDNWYLCIKTATATAGSRSFGVKCIEDGMFVDAVQLENLGYRTTYVDGDQPGCEWSGTVHASTSTRAALSRSGGRVYDLDDYDMYVEMYTGGGMPRVRHHSQSYSLLPGSYHQGTKVQDRTLILRIWAKGTSLSDLHDERQDFLKAIEPDSAKGSQPFILRYAGATVTKDIQVRYAAGMEGGRFAGYKEQLVLRLLAEDPFWYGRGEVSAVLDTNDSGSAEHIVGRIDGAWDMLGSPANSGDVYVVRIGPDGYVYIGGNFANLATEGNADDIAYYDGSAWGALGTGTDDGDVRALVFAPDGTLYAGGAFTGMGGVGTTARIAAWGGAAWAALGDDVNDGTVHALVIGQDGYLYAGGTFTGVGDGAAGTVANTSRIAYYDGSAWNAMGTGMNNAVYALTVGLDGKIYAGGAFTTAGGNAAANTAVWDGSSWAAMGTGAGNSVFALATGLDGTIYSSGALNIGGVADADYIGAWNGTAWGALGTGVNGLVEDIHVAPDGMVYIIGAFSTAGDLVNWDLQVARWNGTTWAYVDIDLVFGISGESITTTAQDPVVPTNYDVYLGLDNDGTAYYSGTATVTNNGTRIAYPRIEISRSGGTSADIYTIRNETTGREMLFDYALQDGEKLTIDCRPGRVAVTSDFFGNRIDALLKGSDFATFALDPGANTISSFVNVAGAPTITAYIVWRDTYWSAD